MLRTTCASTIEKIGESIRLCGWVNARRDHGKIIFIDLRDRTGVVQVVFAGKLAELAKELRDEFVIEVTGTVQERPENLINSDLPTGTVEVKAGEIKILARAETPPFDVTADGREVDERLRFEYRYLDLRRPRMVKNLELRHRVVKHIRNFLDDRSFIEIETPIITKATPEGARDFIVPSRLQPGKFYALPQSPQQYKQLLMVAGFEKYYQIARCFRDEDPRADRAYGEFAQLDLEMSFATQDEILDLTEALMIELAEKVVGKEVLYKPFPRFTYAEALEFFGGDKFDLRKYKREGDKWTPINDQQSAISSGSGPSTSSGRARSSELAFAWVVDFPLFEKTETKEISPSHHPFTAPKDEDISLLETDPMKARSWQHDLVCNGYEVGGGSIRITDPDVQRKIFEILGHSQEEVESKFGHLLKAFEYGVPPHGGIASGIDRLLMVFSDEENLREVFAFPMVSSGRTAVMDAPSEVDEEQLRELGIKVEEEKSHGKREIS